MAQWIALVPFVAFSWVIQFSPTVQKHTVRFTGYTKLPMAVLVFDITL